MTYSGWHTGCIILYIQHMFYYKASYLRQLGSAKSFALPCCTAATEYLLHSISKSACRQSDESDGVTSERLCGESSCTCVSKSLFISSVVCLTYLFKWVFLFCCGQSQTKGVFFAELPGTTASLHEASMSVGVLVFGLWFVFCQVSGLLLSFPNLPFEYVCRHRQGQSPDA